MTGFAVALWLVVLGGGVSAGTPAPGPALRTGDLAFQTSRSEQSAGIQLATGSPWSHFGVVEVAPDGVFVVEAIGRVSRTRWDAWRGRGKGDVLVLRTRDLADPALRRVVAEAKRHLGKPYDGRFGWGDDRMYCSELVWKAFARGAGVELGVKERLGDLHVAGLERAIAARWGAVPRDLVLVTPASLAGDPRLAVVHRGR